VLSEVLLSPDLAPHILAQLPTKEHAAKGTCRAWRRGWKETLARRERPRLLVIGGQDNEGGTVNSLERYDPSTNEWEEKAVPPMHTARKHAPSAMLDGKLYTVGGCRPQGDATFNSVKRYDLAANAWEEVAPMATARLAHAAAVLDGKLYAVGGYNEDDDEDEDGHNSYLSSVERYDPVTNAWEAVAPMATARDYHAVTVLDGKLYAVGGGNDDVDDLSTVERYDPATNAWEEVAPLATARSAHAVAALDGKLYAVGGGGFLSSMERYDPATNVWEEVAPMASARDDLAVAVLDGKLYAVGGSGAGHNPYNRLSSVERYDPAENAWEAVAPLAAARVSPVAVLM